MSKGRKISSFEIPDLRFRLVRVRRIGDAIRITYV
jgi:hypothetical protein